MLQVREVVYPFEHRVMGRCITHNDEMVTGNRFQLLFQPSPLHAKIWPTTGLRRLRENSHLNWNHHQAQHDRGALQEQTGWLTFPSPAAQMTKTLKHYCHKYRHDWRNVVDVKKQHDCRCSDPRTTHNQQKSNSAIPERAPQWQERHCENRRHIENPAQENFVEPLPHNSQGPMSPLEFLQLQGWAIVKIADFRVTVIGLRISRLPVEIA